MSSMPWVKIWTEMLDDHKFGRLDDAAKWRFVQLCLLAGECDAEGYFANGEQVMGPEDIAWRLRLDPGQLAEELVALDSIGLISSDDGGAIFVTNFAKRQGRPQHEKRKLWRERKQRQREREQDTEENADETLQERGRTPKDVTRESPVSPTIREEKEKSKSREDHTGKPVVRSSPGLSEGQRLFLAAFGAKRFRTNPQKAAVLALEQAHGTDILSEGVQWAAKQGMNMGKAVLSLETALPKWGKPKGAKDAVKVSGI